MHHKLALDITKIVNKSKIGNKSECISKSTLFIDTNEEDDFQVKDNHVIPNTSRNHYVYKALDINIIEENIKKYREQMREKKINKSMLN